MEDKPVRFRVTHAGSFVIIETNKQYRESNSKIPKNFEDFIGRVVTAMVSGLPREKKKAKAT